MKTFFHQNDPILRGPALMMILLFPVLLFAQDKSAETDKVFQFATTNTPGCSCTISQKGQVVYNRTFGIADLERGVPIKPDTRFDIASARKQFIAATILLLVQDGKLSLSDDIRKYLKELPDYGYKITVDQLLTRTSGIRDWTGILPLAGGDPTALSLILRQRELNFVPGSEWSYSNSGFVLLIEIAERILKKPFAQIIHDRVFSRLDMNSTTYVSDMQQVIPNRALGYAKQGDSWKTSMYLGNDRGGGAIFSTTTDLVNWLKALDEGTLGKFVTAKLQEPAVLNNGRKLGYARGLTLDPYADTILVWHSGGAAGYHTWTGRVPSQGLAIAVTCNSDAASASSVANRLLKLYANTSAAPVAEDGPPPTLTGDALAEVNQYSGLFFSEKNGDPLTLAVDRDRFRVAGGPGLAMVSKGHYRRWANSVFFLSQDAFELSFQSPDKFELKSMEGQITRYYRAKLPTLSSADLSKLKGRYKSDELNAFIDITPADGFILAGLNDGPKGGIEAKPVATDIFQFRGIFLKFLRDNKGKIIALDYSNPVVSHIKFKLST